MEDARNNVHTVRSICPSLSKQSLRRIRGNYWGLNMVYFSDNREQFVFADDVDAVTVLFSTLAKLSPLPKEERMRNSPNFPTIM